MSIEIIKSGTTNKYGLRIFKIFSGRKSSKISIFFIQTNICNIKNTAFDLKNNTEIAENEKDLES